MSIREGFRRRAWYKDPEPWYTYFPLQTDSFKYQYDSTEEYLEDKIFETLEKRSKKSGKLCIDIEVPDNVIHILHKLAYISNLDYRQKTDIKSADKSYYFRYEEGPNLNFISFYRYPHILISIVPITFLDNYFKGNRLQIRESEYRDYMHTMDLYFYSIYTIKQLQITKKELKTLTEFHEKVKQIRVEKSHY